jgi:hypothetical protein
MELTDVEVNVYDVILEVSGYYSPPEPMVMYYADGTGYPGSSADFDIETVTVEGVNIYELLSEHVKEIIAEEVIDKQISQEE